MRGVEKSSLALIQKCAGAHTCTITGCSQVKSCSGLIFEARSVCHPSVGTGMSSNIEIPLTRRLCRRVPHRVQKLCLSPPVRLLLWRSACSCAAFCEPSSPQQTWAGLVSWPDLPQGKRRHFQIAQALVKWDQVFGCCEHPATRPEFLKCHPWAQSFHPQYPEMFKKSSLLFQCLYDCQSTHLALHCVCM